LTKREKERKITHKLGTTILKKKIETERRGGEKKKKLLACFLLAY